MSNSPFNLTCRNTTTFPGYSNLLGSSCVKSREQPGSKCSINSLLLDKRWTVTKLLFPTRGSRPKSGKVGATLIEMYFAGLTIQFNNFNKLLTRHESRLAGFFFLF